MTLLSSAAMSTYATWTGVLYLFVFVGTTFSSTYVTNALVVQGDAAKTAMNIASSRQLFGLALVVLLAVYLADLAIAVLLHELLAPVNGTLSLIATLLRGAFVAVAGLNLVNYFIVLALATGSESIADIQAETVYGLISLFTEAFNIGLIISLGFFGVHILFVGYLAYLSDFFPAILGIALVIAALAYFAVVPAFLLLRDHRETVFMGLLVPALVEGAFTIWLLVKGFFG